MMVRAARESDIPALRAIWEREGYGFPFPENISTYQVVTDDLGNPILAAGYKLVPEVTLICGRGGATHPLTKLRGIALVHKALRDILVAQGHHEAHAFLAPAMEKPFARHLEKYFGWVRAWTAYAIRERVCEEGPTPCPKA